MKHPYEALFVLALGLQGACDPAGWEIARHEAAVEEAEGDRRIEVPPGALDAWEVAVEVTVDPPEATDLDRDGFPADEDQNDLDPLVFPGAAEVPCDGLDADGDGLDPCTPDDDGDGVRASEDCDDRDPTRGPLAAEIRCNGADENCDGEDDCDRDDDGVLDRNDPDPDDPEVGATWIGSVPKEL